MIWPYGYILSLGSLSLMFLILLVRAQHVFSLHEIVLFSALYSVQSGRR
jgi:hypothetical protein